MQRNSTSQGHVNVLNGKQTQQKYQGPNSKKDEKTGIIILDELDYASA